MLPFAHLFTMKAKLSFCAILALAFSTAVSAQTVRDENSAGPKNAVVLIIRHAEDADSGKGLSPSGITRAGGYANYFKNFTIDGKPLKLNYIFATKDSRNSHRPRLTIEPTAQEFGLAVDSRFKNKQFMGLVDEIRNLPPNSNILISWHHGKIRRILNALGADAKALLPDGRWPDDEFGWVIQLRYDENGRLVESKRIGSLPVSGAIMPKPAYSRGLWEGNTRTAQFGG
jgi:broad specificity phosphatase PhoE